jgi:hypothetical protein
MFMQIEQVLILSEADPLFGSHYFRRGHNSGPRYD